MAGGRVIGPLIGGTMFAVSPQLLGLVGAAIMIMAAVTFIVLERRQDPYWRRNSRNDPVAPISTNAPELSAGR